MTAEKRTGEMGEAMKEANRGEIIQAKSIDDIWALETYQVIGKQMEFSFGRVTLEDLLGGGMLARVFLAHPDTETTFPDPIVIKMPLSFLEQISLSHTNSRVLLRTPEELERLKKIHAPDKADRSHFIEKNKPDFLEVPANLANALQHATDFDQKTAAWREAIPPDPAWPTLEAQVLRILNADPKSAPYVPKIYASDEEIGTIAVEYIRGQTLLRGNPQSKVTGVESISVDDQTAYLRTGKFKDKYVLNPIGAEPSKAIMSLSEVSSYLKSIVAVLSVCHENGFTLFNDALENSKIDDRDGVVRFFDFNNPRPFPDGALAMYGYLLRTLHSFYDYAKGNYSEADFEKIDNIMLDFIRSFIFKLYKFYRKYREIDLAVGRWYEDGTGRSNLFNFKVSTETQSDFDELTIVTTTHKKFNVDAPACYKFIGELSGLRYFTIKAEQCRKELEKLILEMDSELTTMAGKLSAYVSLFSEKGTEKILGERIERNDQEAQQQMKRKKELLGVPFPRIRESQRIRENQNEAKIEIVAMPLDFKKMENARSVAELMWMLTFTFGVQQLRQIWQNLARNPADLILFKTNTIVDLIGPKGNDYNRPLASYLRTCMLEGAHLGVAENLKSDLFFEMTGEHGGSNIFIDNVFYGKFKKILNKSSLHVYAIKANEAIRFFAAFMNNLPNIFKNNEENPRRLRKFLLSALGEELIIRTMTEFVES